MFVVDKKLLFVKIIIPFFLTTVFTPQYNTNRFGYDPWLDKKNGQASPCLQLHSPYNDLTVHTRLNKRGHTVIKILFGKINIKMRKHKAKTKDF